MKNTLKGLYLADIKRTYKDKVYHTYLLRRSYREAGKVKQQTIANLTDLPEETRAVVKESLRGAVLVPVDEGIEITRSRSHGQVMAVRAMIQTLALPEVISRQASRESTLVEALLVARILCPQTKLATIRWWNTTTLAEDLGIDGADVDQIYQAMDWLVKRQARIETALAKRHLCQGGLVLYDVSSSYYEGSHCPLAAFGYNRDRKMGKRQIVYGLMTDADGRPISIQAFPGSTADPTTVDDQVVKLKERFGLDHVVLAGDRGMLTQMRIEKLQAVGGIDWVSALRAPSIKQLVRQGYLQPSLFDERDLMEITSPDYPGERLVVCRNPFLAEERFRTRRELLAVTEAKLASLAKRVAAGRLQQAGKIGQALGKIAHTHRMAKHFEFTVGEGRFSYRRQEESIAAEAALDGFYVIRTSVPSDRWVPQQAVSAYKSLSLAERAFRTLKGIDLKVRPIHHRLTNRVRAHLFLCLLAYYVEWHLRQAWRSLIFDDEEPGEHEGGSPVFPALRSESALQKAHTRKRPGGEVVHSFQSLLAELSTMVRNEVWVPAIPEIPAFTLTTIPNQIQREALNLVGSFPR